VCSRNTVCSWFSIPFYIVRIPCADLDRIQLEHKIRLLTFASLGFKHVGHDLPYSIVAEALHVDATEVEKWAIDGENGHTVPLG
jgi:hypothetical protein